MIDGDGELWEKHAGELIRFATMLVGPSDAEDLLSVAFVSATAAPGWSEVANKRAYLFRAVSNHAQKLQRVRRNRSRRESGFADCESSAPMADVEALMLLSRLSVRQRGVVWMAYWLDATSVEIAVTLNISRRTVERELRAARRQLNKELT